MLSPPLTEADKADVELAVAAARKAFDHGEWPRMSGKQRGKVRAQGRRSGCSPTL